MSLKTKYVCSNCGFESGKWYGRCPDCSSWNSLSEVLVEEKRNKASLDLASKTEPQVLSKIKSAREERMSSGFDEFDRVMGGAGEKMGIVPGSVVLLSGDPGVGKSTLLLEVAINVASRSTNSEQRKANRKVLYITGEESESQIKLRAERLDSQISNDSIFIFSTSDIESAISACEKLKPDLVIVDSIQTMASTAFPGFPGSVPQIRHATSRVVSFSKKTGTPVFIVGHVTKEGIVAGPMILSHMVDVVLYLEGENLTGTRILRAFKNRFGDTSEVGIFTMEENGLAEIKNPSDFFTGKTGKAVPGSCLSVVMEGTRPIIVEIQALVIPSNLSFPRRVSNGIPDKRLELLLAVIQKHCRLPLDRMDVFVNVVGGLKITETSSDLAVALATISSFKNKALKSAVALAEVGILGELKEVINQKARVKEAKKLGFKNILISENSRFLNDVIKKI